MRNSMDSKAGQMKKVSIIVPAYNSGKTLTRCLTSLVNQTLQDIEIIIINDASSDNTWEIMRSCKEQFPDKVVIIDGKINRGSGGARNQGFDVATGEYIGLVDSDDYVASIMYELLYNKAKEGGYDIVDTGFYSESKDTATLYTGDNLTGYLDDDKRKALIACGGYLVTKIFKRELWEEPQIRMRENIRCLEDTEILIYMFMRAGSIGNVKEVLYNYCDIEGSATKTLDLNTYFDSIYGAIRATYDRCHELPSYEECKKIIEYAMTRMYSFGVNRCIHDQIVRYGASTERISKYFDDCGKNEEGLLKKLSVLKNEVITIPYDQNEEVKNRIAELDVEIIKECDKRFAK